MDLMKAAVGILAQGNPGAMAFIMEAFYLDTEKKAMDGFERMYHAGIIGERLYMLWNDCCGRDTDMAIDIMVNKDITIIKEHVLNRGRGIPFEKLAAPCGEE